ncbi:TPA: replication protein [Klebsiella pneumoniae]|uniref:Phage replication protein O n=1 Tax=Klebsiella pneumoniae TaxID=573 RepID=A0A486NWI7_KLEPN|nr:replication protein [Klebsiella pneumoniae]WHJ04910.1 replication protein [Klebsiella pneumoniae subsp. pneumoniae]HEE1689185.1 replication protein [Klebsiella pneumoniae subsp. ozaenae]ATM37900.1 replication protein [Klebsiella pneumoniae]EKT9256749.1 replication protein [Klebsiella pneumoniae]EKU9285284.1 replication protein [Klebsiella pneumoniae]
MANTAEVINFPVPVVALQELRVADLDDGFTRIANELLEAVMRAGLSQHQLLVFMAVMRKTYGFNKKSDWVSNEQLSELTGILPHKCSAAKSVLVKRGILTQTGRVIGINKTVSEWSSLPVKGTEKRPYLKKVTLPESGKKSLPESGNAYYPNQVNTKDKHTKDNKDNINNPPKSPRAVSFDALAVQLPDWLSAEIWSSWVAYRRDLKKPIKSQQTVTQAINLLERCKCSGYQPEEIINQSIANGWQGLFEPKGAKQPSRAPSRVSENFAGKDYGQTEIPAWARD